MLKIHGNNVKNYFLLGNYTNFNSLHAPFEIKNYVHDKRFIGKNVLKISNRAYKKINFTIDYIYFEQKLFLKNFIKENKIKFHQVYKYIDFSNYKISKINKQYMNIYYKNRYIDKDFYNILKIAINKKLKKYSKFWNIYYKVNFLFRNNIFRFSTLSATILPFINSTLVNYKSAYTYTRIKNYYNDVITYKKNLNYFLCNKRQTKYLKIVQKKPLINKNNINFSFLNFSYIYVFNEKIFKTNFFYKSISNVYSWRMHEWDRG